MIVSLAPGVQNALEAESFSSANITSGDSIGVNAFAPSSKKVPVAIEDPHQLIRRRHVAQDEDATIGPGGDVHHIREIRGEGIEGAGSCTCWHRCNHEECKEG